MSELEAAVNDPVCSVCEGHEADHTGCANAVQHFHAQTMARAESAEADVARLAGENTRLREALESVQRINADTTLSQNRALDLIEEVTTAALSASPSAGRHLTAEDAEKLTNSATEILGVLDSGSEPWAPSGYGYEHMGDFSRDVRPLCDLIIALLAPAPATEDPDEPDPLAGLPPDLAAILRDQSVIVPQDSRVFELIAEWANAPSNTASKPILPAPATDAKDAT